MEINWHKILLFMRDWNLEGGGVTTQRRGAIFCNRSEKFGQHFSNDINYVSVESNMK